MGLVIALPLLGILGVTGVFSYFTADYQEQWEVQVESEKSILTTLQFKDEDFGVIFNHASGRVNGYMNDTPIPSPIIPYIEDGKLVVPVDDETYLEPDFLMKLKNEEKVTLPQFIEELKKTLNLDLKFERGTLAEFPKLSQDTEILMLGEETPYQEREKFGKHFMPEKTGQSDLIYFFKQSEKSQTIWILIVSSMNLSAAATVEKMTTNNFEDKNLWFHTLEFIE